jgi:hypothetical protein
MRGQYIAGMFLLLNEKAAIRRLKKNCMYPGAMPLRYPCLLDSRIGADEDPYAHYVYLIDVENMRDALLKAEESVPTAKQQPQPESVTIYCDNRLCVNWDCGVCELTKCHFVAS